VRRSDPERESIKGRNSTTRLPEPISEAEKARSAREEHDSPTGINLQAVQQNQGLLLRPMTALQVRKVAPWLLVLTAVDWEEQKKIEHQLELATRAAAHVSDETTIQRLRNYAEELRQKLFQMVRRPKVRARAYELWTQAGQPPGRDIEFWLEAERQIKDERER
jgi:hypothetical protein